VVNVPELASTSRRSANRAQAVSLRGADQQVVRTRRVCGQDRQDVLVSGWMIRGARNGYSVSTEITVLPASRYRTTTFNDTYRWARESDIRFVFCDWTCIYFWNLKWDKYIFNIWRRRELQSTNKIKNSHSRNAYSVPSSLICRIQNKRVTIIATRRDAQQFSWQWIAGTLSWKTSAGRCRARSGDSIEIIEYSGNLRRIALSV